MMKLRAQLANHLPNCLNLRLTKRACRTVFLVFLALVLIGHVEETGGIEQWVSRFLTAVTYLTSPPTATIAPAAASWQVLNFTDGKIFARSDGAQLHQRLPSDRQDLEAVRSDIFNRDALGCSVQLEFGSWPLCSVGRFALPKRDDCIGIYTGDLERQEFQDRVVTYLPCSRMLGFNSSGLPLASNNDSKAPVSLTSLLRRAKNYQVPIDLLFTECEGMGNSAIEMAAADRLLKTVRQMVLRIPEDAPRPLQALALLSAVHANGFRQWGHSTASCSPLNGMCWEHRLINARFLLEPDSVSPGSDYKAAEELLGVNLTSLSSKQLKQLYQANVKRVHVNCPLSISIGSDNTSTSLWDVCLSDGMNLVTSKPNCIVLAFQSRHGNTSASPHNRAANFYEQLASKYNCWVHIYDSGFNGKVARLGHNRPATVWRHYQTRLGSGNASSSDGVKVRPLCSILQHLGYLADQPIDILLLDADSRALAGLEVAANAGCLDQLKQVILVSDTIDESASQDYPFVQLKTLQSLQRIGFRAWLWRRSLDDRQGVRHLLNLKFTSMLRESLLGV